MRGILNKGFVKYSLGLIAIGLCLILFALYGPAEGKGELHETGLTGETGIRENPSVEVMGFYEMMDNEGGEEAPPKPEPPEPEETNDPIPKTSVSGGGGGGFSGGGGGNVQCPPPTHKVCDYGQRACKIVDGEGADECEKFDDCIHTECDYEEEVCLTIDCSGEDGCETNEDCMDECTPPYLEVDKEANPTELYCEETTITLTIEGKGEACEQHYPVDVVLVFDNSGSMDDDGWDDNISDWQPIGDAKIAAKTFVDFLGSNDKLGLVSFNTNAKLEQGLTFNKNAVKSAIDGMGAGGWTNMSQGIDYGTRELVANGRVDVPWVQVMLSDGNNNCGSKSPPPDCHQRVFESVQEAVDNGIVIYTIALGENANQSLMGDIANLTGGKSYYVPDSEDLEEIYEEIAEEVITTVAGTNVVVTDYMPDYVELNVSTLPGECEYNESERKITCELGTVNINETLVISFKVYLYQLGYNLTNVYPDSGVEYLNYNETTVFEEFPETYVTVYGCEHTFCNYVDMICDSVIELEPGEDECETFGDCPHHKICDYDQQACKIVEGAGTDECQTYDNCLHDICDYSTFTCEEEPVTKPGDSCSVNSDCYEKICDYGQQVCKKAEPGTPGTLCSTYDDCIHNVCEGMSCITSQSPGTDECSTDAGCTDYVCNYVDLTCDAVAGNGYVECQTFDDCEQHRVCDYVGQQCKVVEGPGEDQCLTFDDCVHTICSGMSCIIDESQGIDECTKDSDCIDYVCQDISCVAVAGTGQVGCVNDDDCRHYECDYIDRICEPVAGDGTDECETFDDCYYCGDGILDPGEECEIAGDYAGWGPWGHEYTCKGDNTYYHCVNCQYEHVNECEYYCSGDFECDGHPPMTYLETCDYGYDYLQDYCNEVCELEDNNCESDYTGCTSDPECDELEPNTGDCNYMCQYKPSHMECNYQKLTCELVGTPGDDECVTFGDCPQHKVCDYILDQCKIVEGEGVDECSTFGDCTHTECNYVDLTCDTAEAPGTDECVTFDDCEQHRVCDYVGQQCKVVEGPGMDECQTYDNCFHDICDYSTFTCEEEPVTKPGDSCSVNSDCYEKICDYDQFVCKKVQPGTPGTSCMTWDDCAFCGDGMVTPPEECELPGTNNNLYCSQTTSECSGKKLGTRDAYGDCGQCICEYDPFEYSCVKGQCGAECDSNDDCGCPGDKCHQTYPNWLDYPEYSTCSEEDCTCADCEPVGSICHPNCMKGCEVDVKVGHDMNPDWTYPYNATDDIWIMATDVSNGACDGWTIRIRYWWCSCPNKDPLQSAIEYTERPKYDRLCSANAAGTDNPTHSLECSPCEWRDYFAKFKEDSEKKFWTNVGTSKGTFQIDVREYYNCYDRVYAPALACAAKSEDDPYCTSITDPAACENNDCAWEDAACAGGQFACSNVRKRATCTNVGCKWINNNETVGDYCRKIGTDPFSFDCADITNKGSCNDYTNGKCYWEAAHCE
ncbi:MAG: VWA domain-containing protein [Candidatus Aenigmarchaeota archaeon]|nr:VWA domain-containing protein [Candidatus Aenigmarchaeota archaeon]NIP40113.1 VWA domain-containing protein [Candidatus Aenigmarchaeota archaeon]NIQ18190.1 VWA domain-containing protein [Candidatus Aenigmarchaeota archaeon]NIS72947.1 VWA domain-containing protein [Candidatus Aenigmarchaeota archaeon]